MSRNRRLSRWGPGSSAIVSRPLLFSEEWSVLWCFSNSRPAARHCDIQTILNSIHREIRSQSPSQISFKAERCRVWSNSECLGVKSDKSPPIIIIWCIWCGWRVVVQSCQSSNTILISYLGLLCKLIIIISDLISDFNVILFNNKPRDIWQIGPIIIFIRDLYNSPINPQSKRPDTF